MGNSAFQAKCGEGASTNGHGWSMQSLNHLENDLSSGCGSPEEKNNFLCCIASRYITRKNFHIKTSLNWVLILGRTAYICDEKNLDNHKNGRLSVALLPAEGTLSLMMYQYMARGVHGEKFNFESSLKSKQTTDFGFFSRMTISPTKLLQLNQHTNTDSEYSLPPENDNAFCSSDVIQIELALKGAPYSDGLKPLLPINNEANKPKVNHNHWSAKTYIEPHESACEDPCIFNSTAVCGYSQDPHYDVWLKSITDDSPWTHIQMESSSMVIRNTGMVKNEVNFQRDLFSILQKSLYSVETNFEDGLNETIYTPNGSEIEIIIFCSYGSLLISNESSLNCLVDDVCENHNNKEKMNSFTDVVLQKKASENLIKAEYVEKTSDDSNTLTSLPHRSYINIVKNNGNPQLKSSTGHIESLTETEAYLKALHDSIPSNLHLINGFSQCSVVQLRLKGKHSNSGNCSYAISRESESINEFQKLKLEWNILQVHGGSAMVLQQHLIKHNQTIDRNLAMSHVSFDGNDNILSELNMHIINCDQLCDALHEWFTNLNPNTASSKSAKSTCTLTRLNDVQKSFTTATQAVVFFTSQPYRPLRILSCFNSGSKSLFHQCFEYCLRGELPTLRFSAVQWMIGYSFTFFKLFGLPNYEKMSSMHGDVFKTFSCGVGLLLDHQNEHVLNDSVVNVFHKAFSDTQKNESNSFYTFCIQEVLLTFVDCCFFIFLDKSAFPTCLCYNFHLLKDETKEITPMSLILQMYRSFVQENTIGQDLWTKSLKLRISHFVSRLCSLLQKECQEKTLFESSHTSSQTFCHDLLKMMNIKECLQHPCTKKIHEELSSQKWTECYHLCEQAPVENSYRTLALIDYYRFKKEWVEFSFPLYETNIFLHLAKECLKIEPNTSFEIKLQAQLSYFHYLNVSLECGKILYLVELELNVPFFSRLLRHPSARKELKLELNPHIKNASSVDSGNNKLLKQDAAVLGKDTNPNKCQSLPTVVKFLYPEGIFKALFPFQSKLCETRIEFMNFVEVTETLLENQVYETHSESPESLIPSDSESLFLTPINASAILDTIEWFKLFCWVIHFPTLEWYPGCHMVSPNTIVTAVVVNSQDFTNDQVLQILKNEIYHSASVLALKQLSVTTSAPLFLVENANSRVDTDKANFSAIVKKISSYT